MKKIRWPAKRKIGIAVSPFLLLWQLHFLDNALRQPYTSPEEAIGGFIGSLVGSSIWWYIVYRLIRYPEKDTIGLSKILGSSAFSAFGKNAIEENKKTADPEESANKL